MGLVTSLTRSADHQHNRRPLSISSLIYGSSGCFNRRKNALGLLFQNFRVRSVFCLLASRRKRMRRYKSDGGQGVVLVNTRNTTGLAGGGGGVSGTLATMNSCCFKVDTNGQEMASNESMNRGGHYSCPFLSDWLHVPPRAGYF